MSSVRQALQSALDKNGGAVAFDAFMGIALHHPQDGYYARNIRGIGARGDFTTVPQKSPTLGKAVAGWLRCEASARGWKDYAVIECGPGDGSLATAVIKNLGFWERRRIALHLVETSERLRESQQLKVSKAAWHSTIEKALAACHGRALIFHNEFFDAFPCRVLRKEADHWSELHLRVTAGKLSETFLPPKRPLPDSDSFRHAWPENQRIEVFASAQDWMQGMSGAWREGAMLAIDYGGKTKEIYHRRPQGTLRAYRGQQRLAGEAVYEIPGRQDITADVNFDDLQKWAGDLGWEADELRPLDAMVLNAPGAEAFRTVVFRK